MPREAAGHRLDQTLAALVPGLSRAQAQRLIAEGRCLVDGRRAEAAQKVAAGEAIMLHITEPTASLPAEFVPLDILYEDDWIVVVNKPPGMVAHPGRGAARGTVLNALLAHVGAGIRPALVHRLDRDTSGALLAAKTVAALRDLRSQMEKGCLRRTYWALVWGIPQEPEGSIEAAIAPDRGNKRRMCIAPRGRPARTDYRVLAVLPGVPAPTTLVEARLGSGRTHQVRVHFEHMGHPLVGERVYRAGRALEGLDLRLPGQALHAQRLAFRHPRSGEPLVVDAPLSGAMAAVLDELRGKTRAARERGALG